MEFYGLISNARYALIDNAIFMQSLENPNFDDKFNTELKKLSKEINEKRLELAESIFSIKTKRKRLKDISMRTSMESHTLDDFETKCRELFEEENRKRLNIKATKEYKDFVKEFQQNLSTSFTNDTNNDDDDDIIEAVQISGNIISMHDPWSKVIMKNPVRNNICGHHYDRDSVNSIIKGNIGIRCPVVGCAKKAYIHPRNLEPDLALLQEIKKYEAEQLAQMYSSSSEEDD